MSYDLYLHPRQGQPALEREALLAHFAGDRFENDGNEIRYSNRDTGVYFHLTWYDGSAGGDGYRSRPYVHFNVNYFRPHTFALEAARVLGPLVKRFDLVVDDRQTDGMGQGEYSEEGFLRG